MSKRLRSVQDLLLRALEIADPQERARFLAEACGVDLALRTEVEELIRAAADAGSFLPAKPVVGPSFQNPSNCITPDGNNQRAGG
jgi:hypothetical protein